MTFRSLSKYNDNSPPIRLFTNRWPFCRTRPFTELWEVPKEHLRRMWQADRGRLLLRTPGTVPFGTCICSTCWDQSFSWTCRYFFGLCYSNIHLYFLDFASCCPRAHVYSQVLNSVDFCISLENISIFPVFVPVYMYVRWSLISAVWFFSLLAFYVAKVHW